MWRESEIDENYMSFVVEKGSVSHQKLGRERTFRAVALRCSSMMSVARYLEWLSFSFMTSTLQSSMGEQFSRVKSSIEKQTTKADATWLTDQSTEILSEHFQLQTTGPDSSHTCEVDCGRWMNHGAMQITYENRDELRVETTERGNSITWCSTCLHEHGKVRSRWVS